MQRNQNDAEIPIRSLLENIQEGIVLFTMQGHIQYLNSSARRILGYRTKESPGNLLQLLHTDDRRTFSMSLKRLKNKSRKRVSLLLRLRHKKRHYLVTEGRLTTTSGITGIILSFTDISPLKKAEDKIAELQHLLETINKNLSEGIFVGQLGKKFIYSNVAFLKITGYNSLYDLQKIKPKALYADAAQHKKIVTELKAKGRLSQTDILLKKKNGEIISCRVSVRLIVYEGVKDCFIGHIRDVTRDNESARLKEKAEQKLINSNNFLQDVINTVAAPLFVKNDKHEWILFNDAFRDGRSIARLKNKTDRDFFPKKVVDHFWKIDREVLRTGKTISTEEVLPQPDGSEKIVVTTKSRFVDDKGEQFVIGFSMDITDRKRFENLIKAFNANLRGVLESTQDQILAVDKKHQYTMFNQAHAAMVKHLSGKDIRIGDNVLTVIPDELVPVVRRELKHAFLRDRHSAEIVLRNKSIFRVMFNAIKDEKGRTNGVAVFAEDFTERKLTEKKLKALNEELTAQNWQLAVQEEELKMALDQLSERNFELDQLMYKTSHDLRSPLSSILGLVNLAKLDQDTANLEQYLGKIESRVLKLDDFIRSMLNYARVNRGELEVSEIDLEAMINGVLHELEYLDNFQSIKTRVKIFKQNIPFRSDRFLLNIIIGNIISNAYKYYNPDAKSYLKITIYKDSENVKMLFEDNGIGIRKEHLDKIFKMFYRATERSQGSGLGMYIVRQAAERVGGKVSIESSYGKGTTITIVVPNLQKMKQ